MNFSFDHDLHIHSYISPCSNNPEQSPATIIKYAEENGLNTVCVTDHFWDSDVKGCIQDYETLNYEKLSKIKPLPQKDSIRFLFGCECELNKDMILGVSPEKYDMFDFIIIPTTHMHFTGQTISYEDAASLERRAEIWCNRIDAVLNMDLPFHKMGLAHLTTTLIAPSSKEDTFRVLNMISKKKLKRLFEKAASVGIGIELNVYDMEFSDDEADTILRPYKIAKECGCKFYCGTDAHHPSKFKNAKKTFERAIAMLDLKESDKFLIK